MIIKLSFTVFFLGFAGNLVAQDTLRVQLHGSVLDAASNKPLPDVMVEWTSFSGEPEAVTFSNSEGHFALFVRIPGQVVLRVEENGYQPLRLSLDDLRPGESARELDLLLRRK